MKFDQLAKVLARVQRCRCIGAVTHTSAAALCCCKPAARPNAHKAGLCLFKVVEDQRADLSTNGTKARRQYGGEATVEALSLRPLSRPSRPQLALWHVRL